MKQMQHVRVVSPDVPKIWMRVHCDACQYKPDSCMTTYGLPGELPETILKSDEATACLLMQ